MEAKLGTFVRDQITGFSGAVTGRAEYITGCKQALVQPPCKGFNPNDPPPRGVEEGVGDFVESRWFDEDRLQALDETPVNLAVVDAGPDKPAPRK